MKYFNCLTYKQKIERTVFRTEGRIGTVERGTYPDFGGEVYITAEITRGTLSAEG